MKLVLQNSELCQLISDSSANQNLWITNMLDRMQLWKCVD